MPTCADARIRAASAEPRAGASPAAQHSPPRRPLSGAGCKPPLPPSDAPGAMRHSPTAPEFRRARGSSTGADARVVHADPMAAKEAAARALESVDAGALHSLYGVEGDTKTKVCFSEASIRRIWQKLDRFNSGNIQVKDIVANASFIKYECPKLLDQYDMVARNGVVKLQDFRRLLLGGRAWGADGSSRGSKQIPELPKVSEDDVRKLFNALADENSFITAKALVEQKEIVMAKFPALIQEFEKIDIDGNSKISWDEIKVYIGSHQHVRSSRTKSAPSTAP